MNGRITARIIEPQKLAVFGFGEMIEFRAKATKETGDRDSAHEPLFVEEGKHACYMNRSTNTPPNGPKSPLIRSKTVSGWAHSFYAHVSNAPKH